MKYVVAALKLDLTIEIDMIPSPNLILIMGPPNTPRINMRNLGGWSLHNDILMMLWRLQKSLKEWKHI